jgi:hypothetical protein
MAKTSNGASKTGQNIKWSNQKWSKHQMELQNRVVTSNAASKIGKTMNVALKNDQTFDIIQGFIKWSKHQMGFKKWPKQ